MSNGPPQRKDRQDTQKTLVDSPVRTPARRSCLKIGSPIKQISRLFCTGSDAVCANDITQKSVIRKTCVRVGGDKKLFNDSEPLVLSPVSPTSTGFSPLTPRSAGLPRSSPVVGFPSDSQKDERSRGSSLDKLDEEVVESGGAMVLLAARAALRLGEASNLPYLKGASSIILLIIEYAERTSSNRQECFRIIKRVSHLCQAVERKTMKASGITPPELEDEAAVKLSDTFESVRKEMEHLSKRKGGVLRQVLQVDKDMEIIRRCDAELEDALKLFSVESLIDIRTCLAEFERKFADIPAQPTAPVNGRVPEECDSRVQRAWSIKAPERAAISSEQGSSKCVLRPVLSDPPPLFFGRGDDLEQLAKAIVGPKPARIAIRGPGGVGKTSLALKLLHHESVKEHFEGNRLFVRCDSATSVEGLISAIELQLGIYEQRAGNNCLSGPREGEILMFLTEMGGGPDHGLNRASTSIRPIIIVLDNFESPWELDRDNVEKFLTRLTTAGDLNLTLVITIRGVERPRGVEWTRPFLPPVQTLDPKSARDMFLDISDADCGSGCTMTASDDLDELIALCGHLPLAIQLMAELTSVEGGKVKTVVDKWKEMSLNTSSLNTGDDPTRNLEVSIQLSLNSPRLRRVPGAGILLSVLALLPGGLREDDLDKAIPHLQRRQECRTTLIRTALAYSDSGRLKVLAPIRAYVSGHEDYKVQLRFIESLQNYFWEFLSIEECDQRDQGCLKRALPELGNVERLIDRVFENDFNPTSAIGVAVNLSQMFLRTSLGKPRVAQLQRALDLSETIGNDKLKADCMYTMTLAQHRYFGTREEAKDRDVDFLKALKLYQGVNDKTGQGNCLLQLGSFYYSVRKFEEAQKSCEQALQFHIEAGCMSGQANTLIYLARILHAMSETELAIGYCNKALTMLRTKYKDPIQEAQCLQFLGYLQFATLCDVKVAQGLLEESFRIYGALSLEQSSNCMDTVVSIGEVAFICSRYDEAKTAFENAVKIFRKTKRRDREANARVRLGQAYLGSQLVAEAAEHIRNGLAIWEEIGNKWGEGTSYVALGDLEMSQCSFAEAEAHYAKALDFFTSDSSHWKTFEAECRMKMGVLRIRINQEEAARECLERALQLYDEATCRRGKADCSRYLAELDLNSQDSRAQREALKRLENVHREYSTMGLYVECLDCGKLIVTTYRSLGERLPKTLLAQIDT